MRLRRYKAAEELFEVVLEILEENDDVTNTGPHLPAKWRRPLVRAFNNYCDATGRDRAYWRKKRREHESR